jgi:hypothetical protein
MTPGVMPTLPGFRLGALERLGHDAAGEVVVGAVLTVEDVRPGLPPAPAASVVADVAVAVLPAAVHAFIPRVAQARTRARVAHALGVRGVGVAAARARAELARQSAGAGLADANARLGERAVDHHAAVAKRRRRQRVQRVVHLEGEGEGGQRGALQPPQCSAAGRIRKANFETGFFT